MDQKDQNKGQEKPLSPEIGTLSEKLAKDPKSRLFVPLAEEYLKAGLQAEAMIVLTDGLKIHPNFHVARAMMGKVYLEQGKVAEAKAEFEQVIKADPENLLAHRRLAKLYKEAGQTDKARTSCQAVLLSNSKDPEMKLLMEELNRIDQTARQRIQERSNVSMGSSSDRMQVEQTTHSQPAPASEPSGMKPPTGSIEAPPVEPPSVSEVIPPTPVIPESRPAALESETPPPSVEPSLEEAASEPPVAAEASPIPETELLQMSEPSPEEAPAVPPTEEITTEALANLYIQQGHYEKGIAIYRRLLAKDPGNEPLFQKLEETVELAKLLNEGPQIKSRAKPGPETPSPAPAPPPDALPKSSSPEPAPEMDRERQKMQKIQRLQLWLDSIKKGPAR
jgi:tetratricopeptide (TPR) repeat protein